jgi:hypothetical protein
MACLIVNATIGFSFCDDAAGQLVIHHGNDFLAYQIPSEENDVVVLIITGGKFHKNIQKAKFTICWYRYRGSVKAS